MVASLVTVIGWSSWADESNTTSTSKSTLTPTTSTTSNSGNLGVGVIIGEPTGMSLKYWLNETMAVDGAFGWSTEDDSVFYMHGDLLWHNFDLIPVSRGRLPVYFGVGGLVRFRDNGNDNQVGIRVPIGLSYMFDDLPLDIFAEIGPAIDVEPDVRGEITGGIGVRYWFQ